MNSHKDICKKCERNMNIDETIIIDDNELCIECATNVLTQNDTIEIIGKYLSPNDLITLKRTLKGFSPNMDRLISKSIIDYRNDMLNSNIRGPQNGTSAYFHNFSGDEYPSFRLENIETGDLHENLEFFQIFDENVLDNYLSGQYDFFDRDGTDYSTFTELLEYSEGTEPEESEIIVNSLLNNTNTETYTFNTETYTLEEVKKLILANLVMEFEPDQTEFYRYKVMKEIEKNSSCLVGDVVYAQEYISSRPEYGIGLIGWDWESSKKILVTDGEGQPDLPQYIINKLITNHVTYNMANNEVFYFIMGADEEIGITTWVLPNVCLRITTANLTSNE